MEMSVLTNERGITYRQSHKVKSLKFGQTRWVKCQMSNVLQNWHSKRKDMQLIILLIIQILTVLFQIIKCQIGKISNSTQNRKWALCKLISMYTDIYDNYVDWIKLKNWAGQIKMIRSSWSNQVNQNWFNQIKLRKSCESESNRVEHLGLLR